MYHNTHIPGQSQSSMSGKDGGLLKHEKNAFKCKILLVFLAFDQMCCSKTVILSLCLEPE